MLLFRAAHHFASTPQGGWMGVRALTPPMDAQQIAGIIMIHQRHSCCRMGVHHGSSLCGIHAFLLMACASDRMAPGGMCALSPRACTPLYRIDAQDTTEVIAIHQIHTQSHMTIHYDSSLCSILGIYPDDLPNGACCKRPSKFARRG